MRLPRVWRARDRDGDDGLVVAPVPEGLPAWMPVAGVPTLREVLPTHTYPDVLRLFHRDEGIDAGRADGWPTPVLPAMAKAALCDVLGRTVSPHLSPGEPQVRQLLEALGTDEPIHALVTLSSGDAERKAQDAGWPTVPADAVQTVAQLPPLALARDLTGEQATRLLVDADVSHLWSAGWIVRCEPTGEEPSSIIAGRSGTAHRLQQAGVEAIPIGHATVWPPHCHTCNECDHDHA